MRARSFRALEQIENLLVFPTPHANHYEARRLLKLVSEPSPEMQQQQVVLARLNRADSHKIRARRLHCGHACEVGERGGEWQGDDWPVGKAATLHLPFKPHLHAFCRNHESSAVVESRSQSHSELV